MKARRQKKKENNNLSINSQLPSFPRSKNSKNINSRTILLHLHFHFHHHPNHPPTHPQPIQPIQLSEPFPLRTFPIHSILPILIIRFNLQQIIILIRLQKSKQPRQLRQVQRSARTPTRTTQSIIINRLLTRFQLPILHSQQPHIHRIRHHESSHPRFLILANAEDATEGLLFDGVVPPEIKRDAAIRKGEIESETTAFEAGDEDLDIVAVAEFFNGFASMLE